jgi:ribosomal protein S18 acetylase RimI-like enzyme
MIITIPRRLRRPNRAAIPRCEPVPGTDSSPRSATPSEAGPLSAALAAAFESDPVLSWLTPNRHRRQRRLVRFFQLELRHVVLPAGRVWTVDGSAGASLELPPDNWRMPIGAQIAHGPAFTRVFGTRLPHAFGLITAMERRHLREPHYYIPYVGVAPNAQGQGLGTTLMRPTLERCDREQLPAYLEATSERNAALYERLDFEHLGVFRLGSSPPLWPMRRPPSPPPR